MSKEERQAFERSAETLRKALTRIELQGAHV
jgi:hypothetical protein